MDYLEWAPIRSWKLESLCREYRITQAHLSRIEKEIDIEVLYLQRTTSFQSPHRSENEEV